MAAIHVLKSWPQFFEAIATSQRVHELRRNDRDYAVGDTLLLQEFDPVEGRYSGRELRVQVTSMTSADVPCAVSGEGLHPDFCILSIALHIADVPRAGIPVRTETPAERLLTAP